MTLTSGDAQNPGGPPTPPCPYAFPRACSVFSSSLRLRLRSHTDGVQADSRYINVYLYIAALFLSL